MPNISDFKIAESVLRKTCREHDVPFVDLPLNFDGPGGFDDGILSIGEEAENLGQVMYMIVRHYMENHHRMYGSPVFEEVLNDNGFWVSLTTYLKSIIYSEDKLQFPEDGETHAGRLYQRPLPWLFMKDIICPVIKKPLTNIKLVYGDSKFVDAAKYFKEGSVTNVPEPNEPFIYINTSVDNDVYRGAMTCVESIRAHDECPVITMKQILNSQLANKVIGLARLAFHDEQDEVDEFISALFVILDLAPEQYPHVWNSLDEQNFKISSADSVVKVAQLSQSHPMMWWNLGLTEKMLEPARGANWSTYQHLNPLVKDFWDKIERIRIKKGRDGVPFDVLLRLSDDIDAETTDHQKTLQSLLAEQRIW